MFLFPKRTHIKKNKQNKQKKTAEKPNPHVTLDHFYEESAKNSNLLKCLHFLSSLSVENSRLDFSLLNTQKMTCVMWFARLDER